MEAARKQKQVKSKQRVADHGEVFTDQREVIAMLDLVKDETERIGSRFLEPACGEGAFVTEILRRKLEAAKDQSGGNNEAYEKMAIIAVGSIYGIDILADNVTACREKMESIWRDAYKDATGERPSRKSMDVVRVIINKNIICGDFLKMTNGDGSLTVFFEGNTTDKG